MSTQFIRNIQFTKLIKAEGRLREFNFRKHSGINEELFTVDVCDDRGNRHIFRMHKENGKWKIIQQPLPVWVPQNEDHLNELIEEELKLN
ncbi:MAG: hypothetical protein SFU87_20430 [Chitinophagaceae bacterium]|jgi:hypothetical protein|nr:hypothetical protein [Chitinophagaceae bacterium]